MRSPVAKLIFPFIRQSPGLPSEEVRHKVDNGIHRFTAKAIATRITIVPINRPIS
jgi:hypothetical protein